MKKLFFLVAVATLFFSCQKEIEPTNPSNSGKGFTFTAGIERLATKADINTDNELVWAKGDQIGVFGASWDDKNQSFTLVGDGGSTTGKFSYDNGEFTATDASFAFFPWNGDSNGSDNGNMYFHLTDAYEYTSGKMLTPLVATFAYDATAADYPAIEFKHAGAAVKVTVNNLPAGAHSICLAADQPVAGWFNVAMDAVGTGAIVPNEPGAVSNSVWLNFVPADAEREFTFLFPVPALTAPKFSFLMYDENDVLVWKKNLKAQKNDLGRGDILEMPAIDITPYSQLDQISVWSVIGTPTDWSGDIPMVCEVDGNIHIAKGVEFAVNDEFKVRKDGAWDESYGNDHLIANDYSDINGSNVRITTAGTYDIIFDSNTKMIKVVQSGCPYPDAGTMPHHTAIKKAKDLGADGTANCYIITAPGAYKIPVVKGNSSESAGTVGGVELLWETLNTADAVTPNSVIAAVDYDEDITDYIFFKTPDTLKPGNALIAAKDAEGNIIWSWHIWIPATEIEAIADAAFYNRKVMDRNLGALEAVADAASAPALSTYGLYYQWGRKDPMFTKTGGITATSELTYQGYSGAGVSVTVEESIKNPTTYYYDGGSDPAYCYWESSDNSELWKDSEKTIYDPCPAGYRVPKYDSSLAMWHYNVADGWTSDATNGWFKYGNITFPYPGYASGSSLSYAGTRTVIWSSKYNSAERGYAAYIRSDKDPIYNYNSYYKAYLGSVRCTMIDGVVEPDPPAAATGIELDGTMSDWADGEALAGDGSNIIEWKYGFDSSNLYFYFKIPTSKINASDDGTYKYKRYIYIALDTDNDETTGASPSSYGGLTMPGCEALALVYPFRGDTTNGLEFVNGEDDASWTRVPPTGSKTGKLANAFGVVDGSYAYVEVGIPMDGIGSPAASKMKVQLSYSWTLSPVGIISTK